MTPRLRGILCVAGAATCWGLSGVVAKILFTRGVDPWTLVEIRLTAASAVLLAAFAASRMPVRVPRRLAVPLVLLGLSMTGAQSAYYLAIHLAGVPTALFLQYTAPVLVAVYGRLIGGEPLTPRRAAAIALTVAGTYALVTGGEGLRADPLGVLSGMGAAVAFAAYVLLGRGPAREAGAARMLLYALGTGAVVWSLIVPPWSAYGRPYTPAEWVLMALIVVCGTVVPFGLFLYGLRSISGTVASLTATVEPVVGSAAAVLILGEALGAVQVAGALAILAGVLLVQTPDPARADRDVTDL
ncbi:MAG: EamA family transporter [Armatimonadota bacterium]|nr:EamA family transporter [Armatimonadota bacterium]MDR7436173.1 EamA family transporter [Armatimonadota bacterium]MDR7472052.1 EamA family transporter [Armatimonadota bacterium]MDR7507147.1 EamA family transporter [Armatimonadota bacterium]MDR7509748.1 EamA family transporter [Armatimonadota bacterium]